MFQQLGRRVLAEQVVMIWVACFPEHCRDAVGTSESAGVECDRAAARQGSSTLEEAASQGSSSTVGLVEACLLEADMPGLRYGCLSLGPMPVCWCPVSRHLSGVVTALAGPARIALVVRGIPAVRAMGGTALGWRVSLSLGLLV